MKSFIDAEFIKECTLAIVNKVCPEKKVLFDSIPLSARTVTRKVEVISEQLKLQLKTKIMISIIFPSHLVKVRMQTILRR